MRRLGRVCFELGESSSLVGDLARVLAGLFRIDLSSNYGATKRLQSAKPRFRKHDGPAPSLEGASIEAETVRELLAAELHALA